LNVTVSLLAHPTSSYGMRGFGCARKLSELEQVEVCVG
jgi:hypothetical protein